MTATPGGGREQAGPGLAAGVIAAVGVALTAVTAFLASRLP